LLILVALFFFLKVGKDDFPKLFFDLIFGSEILCLELLLSIFFFFLGGGA
jgi:hypothetical protein